MIRNCTSADPNLGYDKGGHREWCGRTFDDVDHSTICPHDPLPPKLSLEELRRLFAEIGVGQAPPVAVEELRVALKDSHRALLVVLLANGGRIEVPDKTLMEMARPDEYHLITWRDPLKHVTVYAAERT